MKKIAGAALALMLTTLGMTACSKSADAQKSAAQDAPKSAATITVIDNGRIDRWDPAIDAIVPQDWKMEKLAEGFGWAEGPIWVKSGGYLLFTDVPGNKMWKWSEAGGLE